jgi:SAM-dependent methyltransferase
MSSNNAVARFSDRVEDYVKYRPGYPSQVVDFLQNRCGLNSKSVVADIGSGPGNLARLFVAISCELFAVEPNAPMREAGEQLLGSANGYHSIDGTAEGTRLPTHTIDFITVGQAFHWFDWPRAKSEFLRILRPGGWVALLWNERLTDSTTFLQEYEALLLEYGTDYKEVRHEQSYNNISDFFGGRFDQAAFPNQQLVDFDGLRGRLLSSSYVPSAESPRCAPMLHDLQGLFDKHQRGDRVSIDYQTRLYCGQLG